MNILYLSDTRFSKTPYRDGSTRYRCYHFAEELLRQEHVADVAVIGDIDINIIERYDVVVILRPSLDRRLERVVNSCRDNNVTLIADYDDLIFDPELADQSPIVVNNQATEEQIQGVYRKHAAALQMFDKVTVATQDLAWHVRRVLPEADVLHLPNALSPFWLEYNKHVRKESFQSGVRDISYMPGTRSHDSDFSEVQATLSEVVNHTDNTRLQVIGALDVNDSLFRESKLVRGPWVDFFELPRFIADSWVTIAPLGDTAFNKCKSHVKFIESAAFGTPIISSRCPDISQHHVNGLSLVNSPEEWSRAFESYSDPDWYRQCSEDLRNYVLNNCMTGHSIGDLLSFFETSETNYTHEDITPLSKAS